MPLAPFGEGVHSFVERRARWGERVLNALRDFVKGVTPDHAVSLQLPKLLEKDFFTDSKNAPAKRAEASRLEVQFPKNCRFPFPTDDGHCLIEAACACLLRLLALHPYLQVCAYIHVST